MLEINVDQIKGSKARLQVYENNIKIIETEAYIGRNGVTTNKAEGDGKTPLGTFKLGKSFGTHDDVKNKEYIKINPNLYWVDDSKSVYYNKLIDIEKIKPDFNSAEHLVEYKQQYEYAVEIKTNENNIPGKGSAIFLHCSVERPTAGCVAIKSEIMKRIVEKIDENATICIEI